MKKITLAICFLGAALFGQAQQLQTSSLFDVQGVLHNPSMVGTQKNNFIGGTYRTQWASISGAPKTATLFGSFEIPKYKVGVGGYIYNDVTGPTSRTGINLSFAKHINFDNGAKFSIGIENKLQQYAIDRAKLTATLGNDAAIGSSDTRFKYDAGFGVAYVAKAFTVGASVSQLVQSKLNFYSGNLSTTQNARLYRHYYAHGAYNWDVDGVTTITPNVMAIYLPNAPFELMSGIRVTHDETFWWGVGYRLKQSISVSAGVNINKKYTLGYNYDGYLNPINEFSGGSAGHEFVLRYNFLK
jgi:type IX secretion system PorP/SprF family membrane protein